VVQNAPAAPEFHSSNSLGKSGEDSEQLARSCAPEYRDRAIGNTPKLTQRIFWINYGMLILTLLLTLSLDFRGIWIPRWSIDDHNNIFATLDGRFNHIFLQVFALGEAYYPSRLVPVRKPDDEWLKSFLIEAHRRGIKVSAWLNVFYSWGYAPRTGDMRHPINLHPNWYVEDRTGRSILNYDVEELTNHGIEGYYLTPANAQVRDHICGVIDEILSQYDFDGVHLDYFRFPSRRFSNDVYMRSKFMREYCVDPTSFAQPGFEQRFSTWGGTDLERRLQELVRSDLTDFVHTLSSRIKKLRPHVEISVAVKADYEAASTDFYQDWSTWVNEDIVDFVCLMAYSRNIESILNKTLKKVNDPRKVAVGLGIYRLSTEQIAIQVKQVAALPFSGVVFFSYEELKKNGNYLQTLR
jgi:uncharacterized lipoprotein YddW (UPF0748 family)